jgi:hypothetical protein
LRPGASADFIVIPASCRDAGSALLRTWRRDLTLVTIGGQPMVGAPSVAGVFRARRTGTRSIVVDGVQRIAAARLARAIARCPIPEPGVACT